MDLIIDRDFTKAIAGKMDPESKNFTDFCNFLSRSSELKLITNHKDFDEFEAQVREDPLLELLLTNGLSEKLEFISEDNLEDPRYYISKSPFVLFLVSYDGARCASLSQRFGYEYISPENFEQRWSIYSGDRNDTRRKVSCSKNLTREQKVDSWETFLDFVHPVNSILINDSYILVDQKNQKIKDNLVILLKHLAKKSSRTLPLEIIIFSDIPAKFSADLKQKHARITAELDPILGKDTYKLILLKASSHARFIFTNYFMIRCDNSFNFFKEDGTMMKDNPWIEFVFAFSPKERSLILDDLTELKEMANKLENSGEEAAYEVINYYPVKSCRFFM